MGGDDHRLPAARRGVDRRSAGQRLGVGGAVGDRLEHPVDVERRVAPGLLVRLHPSDVAVDVAELALAGRVVVQREVPHRHPVDRCEHRVEDGRRPDVQPVKDLVIDRGSRPGEARRCRCWPARPPLTERPVLGRFINEIAWNSVVTPAAIRRRSKVVKASGSGMLAPGRGLISYSKPSLWRSTMPGSR